MEMVTLGIDLGKTVCSLTGLDGTGRKVLGRRVQRAKLLEFTVNLLPLTVGIEACFGAHELGRALIAQGHKVRLLVPSDIKPYLAAHKNDDRDADAIAEATTRPYVREVAVKTADQLDLQSLHRVRERLVGMRTALINQMRSVLVERGIRIGRGKAVLARALAEIFAAPGALSGQIVHLLQEMRAEWRGLDERIKGLSKVLEAEARSREEAVRLKTVPGIGPLTATALPAALGDAGTMKQGRDLAAWLGLVPRQHSTGGRTRLGKITKRGNRYVRKLMVHGARSVLSKLVRTKDETALGLWARRMLERKPWNVVVVALANKMARMAWAVLARGTVYEARMV